MTEHSSTVVCLIILLLRRSENSVKPLHKLKHFVWFELNKLIFLTCLKVTPMADEQLAFSESAPKDQIKKEKSSLTIKPFLGEMADTSN